MWGVVESLPVPGVDLLLGNDIAGAKVFPHPIATSEPVGVPETLGPCSLTLPVNH